MSTIYTRKDGLLALKPDRMRAVEAVGGVVLPFGTPLPKEGILLADLRPGSFVGARTSLDSADTAIYRLKSGRMSLLHSFSDFEKALRKAQDLIASLVTDSSSTSFSVE